jgi:hypothetical protein
MDGLDLSRHAVSVFQPDQHKVAGIFCQPCRHWRPVRPQLGPDPPQGICHQPCPVGRDWHDGVSLLRPQTYPICPFKPVEGLICSTEADTQPGEDEVARMARLPLLPIPAVSPKSPERTPQISRPNSFFACAHCHFAEHVAVSRNAAATVLARECLSM